MLFVGFVDKPSPCSFIDGGNPVLCLFVPGYCWQPCLVSIYLGSLTGWRVLLRVGENPRGLDFRILVALGLEHVPGQDITHLFGWIHII